MQHAVGMRIQHRVGPHLLVRRQPDYRALTRRHLQTPAQSRVDDKAQRLRNKHAKAGEADRVILTKMPKHLFSGKRPRGSTDRR